jgi:hypothetical protein
LGSCWHFLYKWKDASGREYSHDVKKAQPTSDIISCSSECHRTSDSKLTPRIWHGVPQRNLLGLTPCAKFETMETLIGDDDYNKDRDEQFIPVDMGRSIADKLRRLLDSMSPLSEQHTLQTFGKPPESDGYRKAFAMADSSLCVRSGYAVVRSVISAAQATTSREVA